MEMTNSNNHPTMSSRRVFALVLAAGQSKRMGRLKQLLPYGDGLLLDAVIDAALEAPLDGLIIIAHPLVADRYEENTDERLFTSINDDPSSEMLDSVRIGVRRLDDELPLMPDDGVMILLGDQPDVGGGIIATCAETYRRPRQPPDILIATYGGRRGHPAIFRTALLREVEAWPPGRRLNELAREHPDAVRELPIITAPMPRDINTPEDYDDLINR